MEDERSEWPQTGQGDKLKRECTFLVPRQTLWRLPFTYVRACGRAAWAGEGVRGGVLSEGVGMGAGILFGPGEW